MLFVGVDVLIKGKKKGKKEGLVPLCAKWSGVGRNIKRHLSAGGGSNRKDRPPPFGGAII